MELGITGHLTRGNEVIEILEMLGGKNCYRLNGDKNKYFYYICDKYKDISYSYIGPDEIKGYEIFSLDDFLEKFPYKVGDKVIIKCKNKKAIVNNVVWCCDTISYWLKYDDIIEGKWKTEHLQPYKEETITIDDFKANTKEWLLDKLQSMSKENTLQTITNLYDELHKPKYPKTYKECCEVLRIEEDLWFVYEDIDGKHINPACISNYRIRRLDLYHNFEKLLICRDAYWKIAGEELGLGKPWEPDWTNNYQKKWLINFYQGEINFTNGPNVQFILAFPTVEMQNAFYESFKDLIEKCKELL